MMARTEANVDDSPDAVGLTTNSLEYTSQAIALLQLALKRVGLLLKLRFDVLLLLLDGPVEFLDFGLECSQFPNFVFERQLIMDLSSVVLGS